VKEEQEEKYYSSLNTLINLYNRRHFDRAVVLDDRYTSSLADFIMASYPRLTQNLLSGSVYTVPKTPFSQRIIPAIVNAAGKGTVVSVRDGQGKLKIYANAGKDEKGNGKRILVLDGHEKDTAKNGRRYFLAYSILKDDIKYVFQNEKFIRAGQAPAKTPPPGKSRHTATPRGRFEAQFKALVREQGTGSSPGSTAQYLFTTMAYSDKKKLNHSLSASGIRTQADMEKLLQRWKSEALRETPLPKHTRAMNLPEYGR
jgi:hypothetical protein